MNQERTNIERAESAGGVIFRIGAKEPEIALIVHSKGRVKSLPKGEINPGETLEEAAIREVKEETGLTGKIIGSLGSIQYWFYSYPEKKKVHKRVYYFLMEYLSGDIKDHDWEVEEVIFVPISKVNKIATYENERKVLATATKIIFSMINGKFKS